MIVEGSSECRKATIVAFLAHLEESYGGAEGYLRDGLGFSDDDVERIRRNLREEKASL